MKLAGGAGISKTSWRPSGVARAGRFNARPRDQRKTVATSFAGRHESVSRFRSVSDPERRAHPRDRPSGAIDVGGNGLARRDRLCPGHKTRSRAVRELVGRVAA